MNQIGDVEMTDPWKLLLEAVEDLSQKRHFECNEPWSMLQAAHDTLTKNLLYNDHGLMNRIYHALAERPHSTEEVVECKPPIRLYKGDKVEVRVTSSTATPEDLPTFSIDGTSLEVDPAEVWVLRFCDLVGIDGSTENKRLEAFAYLYDHVKASQRAAAAKGRV